MKKNNKNEIKESKNFQVLCSSCNHLIEIEYDENMINEFKNYIEEGKNKYKSEFAISRKIRKGCPNCKHDLIINSKKYVDFYDPKNIEERNKLTNKFIENMKNDIIESMPE